MSADGKVLTLTTADAAEIFEGRYDVTVAKAAFKAADGSEIAKFEVTITAKDAVAPTITGTSKKDAATSVVSFSEPLLNEGTLSYKLADGTVIDPKAAGYEIAAKRVGADVEFTLTGTKLINKDITVTFVGAVDYAGNLVNPNPATAVIKKGDKDGVAPTVKEVKFLDNKTLTVEFSEEVAGFDKTEITVTGANASKVTQDTTNKAKYTVELDAAVKDIVTVTVKDDKIVDLSGEIMTADYTNRVIVNADTTNPVVSEAKVAKGSDNVEYLFITFNENVTKVVKDTDKVEFSGKQVKDFITTDVKLETTGDKLVAVDGTKNQFKVKLADLAIGTGALVEGAKYTVDLPAALVEDVSANKNEVAIAKIEFTRGKDGAPTNSQYQEVGAVKVVDTNTVTVEFKLAVDGASATNKANYTINGATIESATLAADEKTVTLNLVKDSVTYSGDRYIIVNGVKTKSNVDLEKEYKQIVTMNENVRPTVVSAVATGGKEITLTFSEDVVVADTNADFGVYFNGKLEGTGVAATAVAENAKQLKITTTAEINGDALAAGVTVKAVAGNDVQDSNKNALNFTDAKTVTLN